MKFSVRSAELQKALAKTVSVVPTRSTLPILENLHFDVHANTLKITATDLEISVSVSLEVHLHLNKSPILKVINSGTSEWI